MHDNKCQNPDAQFKYLLHFSWMKFEMKIFELLRSSVSEVNNLSHIKESIGKIIPAMICICKKLMNICAVVNCALYRTRNPLQISIDLGTNSEININSNFIISK